MFGRSWKFWLIGAVVAAALLTGTSQAKAWCCVWGCYEPVCCYTPCYTSCYAVSYGPSCGGWYLGVRPGPIRRLLFGPYRWYWSPYCGTACVYDVCCTEVEWPAVPTTPEPTTETPTPAQKPAVEAPTTEPSLPPLDTTKEAPGTEPTTEPDDVLRDLPGTLPTDTMPGAALPGVGPAPDTGTEPEATPPADPGAEPAPDASITPETNYVPTRENSGLLTVWVPYHAKVTINGLATKSKGSQRRYVSYGLKPGYSYKYVVQAEVIRDGQRIEDVREVILTAGDRKAVAFGFNPEVTEGLVAR